MFTLDKASTVRRSAPEMVAMHWRNLVLYASTLEAPESTLIDASIPESLLVQLKMLVLAGEEYVLLPSGLLGQKIQLVMFVEF